MNACTVHGMNACTETDLLKLPSHRAPQRPLQRSFARSSKPIFLAKLLRCWLTQLPEATERQCANVLWCCCQLPVSPQVNTSVGRDLAKVHAALAARI